MTMFTTCQWCNRNTAHPLDLTYNGERVCNDCKPYAWASLVHPQYRSANLAIARRRFANK